MTPQELSEAAQSLREAARTGEFIAPLRERYPQLDAESAYAIQRINTEQRIREGRRIVGCKIGLTARAVQAQLGVDRPDFGMLFDDMGHGDGDPVPVSVLRQPKIEAKVAFVFGRDLDVEKPTQVDVMNAIDYALQKSRYGPWVFTAFKLLAKMKVPLGGALDIFGKTEERRHERQMIEDYIQQLDEVASKLAAANHAAAVQLASVPDEIRGYGHVKEKSIAAAKVLHEQRLNAFRGPHSGQARARAQAQAQSQGKVAA